MIAIAIAKHEVLGSIPKSSKMKSNKVGICARLKVMDSLYY